jgi:SAM-dependent methyltransferase
VLPLLPVDLTTVDFEDLLADVPRHIFPDPFSDACTRLDRYVGALACETALAAALPNGEPLALEPLLPARGWVPAGRLGLLWLMETLELYGQASRARNTWALEVTAPRPSAAELKEDAVRACPPAAPSFAVQELSASALPAVLRGETRGEEVLFGPATLRLWFDYFSNANPLYAPSNRMAAAAAVRTVSSGARVLEVGGGGGSAALALLEALAEADRQPASYIFTELQPAFLRRGLRAVQAAAPAACEVRGARYDINRSPEEQELVPGAFDLIFGVNTLHLARDLVRSLAWLRSLLAPGGALVLGELVRPAGGRGVHLELPFALLDSYRQHPVDGEIRTRAGFLTAGSWGRALERAGFGEVAMLPAQLARCVERYPGFYCGAFTARAPAPGR